MNSRFSLFAVGTIGFVAGCLTVGMWQMLLPASATDETASLGAISVVAASKRQLSPKPPAQQIAAASLSSTAPSCSQAKKASERQFDDLLTEILAPPGAETPDPFSLAMGLLEANPADRASLMSRYIKETNKSARMRMGMLLMNLQSEDVIDFASNMTIDSDPAKRAEGYALLRLSQTGSPAARKAILKAVETEQNPFALAEAVASLMPGDSPKPEEAAPIVDQMRRLVQHPSPEVRAESLIALSRWDRGGNTEELIYNGLTDNNQSIKEAALTVLAENGMRTDRLKTALIGITSDDKAAPETRWVASNELEGFSLTQEEHSTLAELRDGLPPVGISENRGN